MAFTLIASIWMLHVIFQQDYTKMSNMAYGGNVLSFPCKVRLCLSKYVFCVLYPEIVWFVYMPACNSLFCPRGVSLLLRTSIYTNLKMKWHTWTSKKKIRELRMALLQNWQTSVLATSMKRKRCEEYMLFLFHEKGFSQTHQQWH